MSRKQENQRGEMTRDLIEAAGPEGIERNAIFGALVEARLFMSTRDPGICSFAIRKARDLPGAPIVYDRRLRVYRVAIDAKDAEAARRLRAQDVERRIGHLIHDLDVEVMTYIGSLAGDAYEMTRDNMQRAMVDVARAARLSLSP